jgi:protein-tyrosine phosphatase
MLADRNEISPGLWVGSAPEPQDSLQVFDVLVLCAEEVQPLRGRFRGEVIRTGFRDTPWPEAKDVAIILKAARKVAARLAAKKVVLVTCAAGLNRSALVAGLALRMVTKTAPNQILLRIRRRRSPDALRNPAFEKLLLSSRVDRSRV